MGVEYRRLRQVCLVSDDLEESVSAICRLFDAAPCYRDPKVGMFGLSNALFAFNGLFLEIVAPTRDGTAAGRFLERGARRGAYMAIFDCNDLEAARQRVAESGVRIIFEGMEPDGGGIQLHPSDVGGAILEIDHHEGGADLMGPYGWAGPDWQRHCVPASKAAICGLTLVGDDAIECARIWSSLIGCPIRCTSEREADLVLDGAPVRFCCEGDGSRCRISSVHMTVGNRDAVLAEARASGLETGPDGFWLLGVHFILYDLLH